MSVVGGSADRRDGLRAADLSAGGTPRGSQRLVVAPELFGELGAALLAGAIVEAVAARGAATVALAGGGTPRPVYERLAGERSLPWPQVHVYFGDERAVPPQHPSSNYGMAYGALLGRVPIPPEHVYRMAAERADVQEAAAEYAALLPERLDLLILGIGSDGHTASLFPGSAALMEGRRKVLAVEGPAPPRRRLTITPPVITAARRVVVLAVGPDKASAVARALDGPDDVLACPAQLARDGVWVLDRDAGAQVRGQGP